MLASRGIQSAKLSSFINLVVNSITDTTGNVKKKGNLATAAGEQAPANTPEAHVGTVSNNSISKTKEKVNTLEKRYIFRCDCVK